MTNNDVMTKEETFAMLGELMSACLKGEPPPPPRFAEKKFLRAEYVEEAMDMITRTISDQFEGVPQKVSDDFETQEVIQQNIDAMVAKIVLTVREALDGMTRI